MKKLFCLALCLLCLPVIASAIEIEEPSQFVTKETFEGGYLESAEMSYGPVQIIHVSGTHFEMGRQYGYLLADQIKASSEVMMLSVVLPSGVDKNLIKALAAQVWSKMRDYVPLEYIEEMRGISEGAALKGVKLKEIDIAMPIMIANISDMNDKESLLRASALNDALDGLAFTCSAFAAWGDRTEGGKLISSRALDWEARTGIDAHKILTIYKPVDADGNAKAGYAVAGWIGFIGAIDGMNQYGITLSEIGSENKKEKLNGMPWTIMFRHVLENSKSLDDAVKIVQDAENTIGYNFVIGDGDAENFGSPAWNPSAAAIEENAETTTVIYQDDPVDRDAVWVSASGEPVLVDGKKVHYGTPLKNAVLRADVAMCPVIRKTQAADNGPGESDSDGNPLVGGSYKKRHISQYNALSALENGGAYSNPYNGEPVFAEAEGKRLVTPETALEITKSAAVPDSSVLTIVYAATDLDMYVSWERMEGDKWTASFDIPYMKVNIKDLIEK